jgi:diacylglycerol kinase
MALLPPPMYMLSEDPPVKRPERRWRKKFRAACRGLKLGVRGQSSFFVHFFVAALVVTAAAVLRCTLEQWCILLGAIGIVLTAELFNSAVEQLFRGLDDEAKQRAWPCLDIAAGAVLLVSIFAAVIGSLIFLRQLEAL